MHLSAHHRRSTPSVLLLCASCPSTAQIAYCGPADGGWCGRDIYREGAHPIADDCCRVWHSTRCRKLLEAGADVNERDGEHRTCPYTYAICENDLALTRLLLGAGADMHPEGGGAQAVACAVIKGNADMLHLVMEHYRTEFPADLYYQAWDTALTWGAHSALRDLERPKAGGAKLIRVMHEFALHEEARQYFRTCETCSALSDVVDVGVEWAAALLLEHGMNPNVA